MRGWNGNTRLHQQSTMTLTADESPGTKTKISQSTTILS